MKLRWRAVEFTRKRMKSSSRKNLQIKEYSFWNFCTIRINWMNVLSSVREKCKINNFGCDHRNSKFGICSWKSFRHDCTWRWKLFGAFFCWKKQSRLESWRRAWPIKKGNEVFPPTEKTSRAFLKSLHDWSGEIACLGLTVTIKSDESERWGDVAVGFPWGYNNGEVTVNVSANQR